MEGTYYYLCELAQFQDNKLFFEQINTKMGRKIQYVLL